jgi:hypothetical protein
LTTLGIVHRDVSPQNILVGTDGVARVLDFGIAKARFRLHSTHDGRLKGKLGYMAPEQLLRESVDNRCDVYGAAAVLWEILAGERLFTSDSHVELVKKIRTAEIPPPSARRATVPPSLDGVAMRGLQRRPEDRYATALDMARALEETGTAGPRREVGAWVRAVAGGEIDARVAQIEGSVSASGDASPVATEVVGEAPPARALLFDVRASDEGTPPPSRPRRARAALAGIAVAALGGSGLLWLSMSGSQRMPPVASAVVRETLDAAAPPPVRASPADPSTPASAAPAKPPRRRHLAKPTQPDCDPPFIIDAEGHKMFKEQCL